MNKWGESTIAEIGQVVSGGTPSTSVDEFWNGGEILFVTPFDLSRNNSKFIANTARKISEKGLKNSSANLLPKRSIVISSRAPIGYVAIGGNDFTTNQGCKSIIPTEKFDSEFLYYNLNFYVERIKRLGEGTTFAEISKGDLEKIKLPHPTSIETQQKIAKILASVDSVIEKTEAAIAKYKAIKQGMLHDLFTRGIDSKTGKLRPKYEDAPELYKKSELGWIPKEWEISIFSEIAEIINGGTPSTDVEDYWGGNIPWLSVDDFNKGKRFVDSASKSITKSGLKNSATHLLPAYATIISARGTVGVIAQLKSPMAFNQSCYGILTKNHSISNDYIYYYLLFYKTFKGFLSFGSVFNTITRKYFDKFWMILPADKKELDLIIKRISHADLQIENEIKYLKKLKHLKKGLMADLLSGRKRVNIDPNQ